MTLQSPSTKNHQHDAASYITEILMIKRQPDLIDHPNFWLDANYTNEFLRIRNYVVCLLKEFPPFLTIDLIVYSKFTDCNFDAIKKYLKKRIGWWIDKRNKHITIFCKNAKVVAEQKPEINTKAAENKERTFRWV